MASQAGEFVLPEIELPWWNTETDSLEIARLPAHTLSVLPGSSPAPVQPPSSSPELPAQPFATLPTDATQASTPNYIWITISGFFAIAWLFSTVMWLRTRRELEISPPVVRPASSSSSDNIPVPANKDAATALKIFQRACNHDNAGDIRSSLLGWARAFFQDPSLLTLAKVADEIQDAEFSSHVDKLESALYGDSQNEYDKVYLKEFITRLHGKGHKKKHKDNAAYSLPPLYKN